MTSRVSKHDGQTHIHTEEKPKTKNNIAQFAAWLGSNRRRW